MGRNQQRKKLQKKKKLEKITLATILLVVVIGIIWVARMGRTTEKATSQSTISSTTTSQTETAEQKFLKNVDLQSWEILLVGPDHKLTTSIDEATTLATVGAFQMNKNIVPAFEELEAAAQAAGYPLVIVSAYRSVAYQEKILNAAIQQKMASGMTYDEALADAKQTMTEPGYSEHHTGLALDVVDQSWYTNYSPELLHSNFGQTDGGKWLAANVAQYGFIIRYPEGKMAITKIDYEPWHIRYVGKENAEYMVKNNLTLEEFVEQVSKVQQK